MSADPPGTRMSAYGPYIPLRDECDCREEDRQECAYMKGELHWSEFSTKFGCECLICHPLADTEGAPHRTPSKQHTIRS